MKKICIISNSNLGSFFRYLDLFNESKIKFSIISEKDLKFRKYKNVNFNFLKYKNNIDFNDKALKIIEKFNPEMIVLFFTKKINKKIFKKYITINIHNSLLPDYKGLNALKKSFKDENKFICSSSHMVNEKFDSGKIINQIVTPVKKQTLKFYEKIAFFQRIILLKALINNKLKKTRYSLINGETLLSPGLGKNKINYKFWI
tara:strand:+ start:214 stop:819 length:606 start_codon:yes stop_codon:yes gene_type:complete